MSEDFNPFVVQPEEIEILLNYVVINKQLLVLRADADKKLFPNAKVLKAYFERPNWTKYNQFMKGCWDIHPETQKPIFDPNIVRERKFRILLKRLLDGDGNEIKLDSRFFNSVNPELAIALVDRFDSQLLKEQGEAIVELHRSSQPIDKETPETP